MRRRMSARQCDRPGPCVAVFYDSFRGVEYWASRMSSKAFPFSPFSLYPQSLSNLFAIFIPLSAYSGKINGRPKHARRNPFGMARNASTSSSSRQGKMRAGKGCVRRSSNIIRLGRRGSKRVFIWRRPQSIVGGFMRSWGL